MKATQGPENCVERLHFSTLLLVMSLLSYALKLLLAAREIVTLTAAPNPDYRLGHELSFHSLSTRLLSLTTKHLWVAGI